MYMYYVYILQSHANHTYCYSYTHKHIQAHLLEHNEGSSHYTSKYRPWKLVWYAGFATEERACEFEKYLKSGSGHAF